MPPLMKKLLSAQVCLGPTHSVYLQLSSPLLLSDVHPSFAPQSVTLLYRRQPHFLPTLLCTSSSAPSSPPPPRHPLSSLRLSLRLGLSHLLSPLSALFSAICFLSITIHFATFKLFFLDSGFHLLFQLPSSPLLSLFPSAPLSNSSYLPSLSPFDTLSPHPLIQSSPLCYYLPAVALSLRPSFIASLPFATLSSFFASPSTKKKKKLFLTAL